LSSKIDVFGATVVQRSLDQLRTCFRSLFIYIRCLLTSDLLWEKLFLGLNFYSCFSSYGCINICLSKCVCVWDVISVLLALKTILCSFYPKFFNCFLLLKHDRDCLDMQICNAYLSKRRGSWPPYRIIRLMYCTCNEA
jgi:hypothetical protein